MKILIAYVVALTTYFFSILVVDTEAVTWQWSKLSDREKVTVFFDESGQGKAVSRVDLTILEIPLTDAAKTFTRNGSAPSEGSLVSGVSLDGTKIHVNLRDAAFGYVSKIAPKELSIDIFPDPLGNRWRDPGVPVSSSAPSRAASALPEPQTIPQKEIKPATEKTTTKDTALAINSKKVPQTLEVQPTIDVKQSVENEQQATTAHTQKAEVPKKDDLTSNNEIDSDENKPTTEASSDTIATKNLDTVPVEEKDQPPPPSLDELTKITDKIDKVFPESGEFTWSKENNTSTDLPLGAQKDSGDAKIAVKKEGPEGSSTQPISKDNSDVSKVEVKPLSDVEVKEDSMNGLRAPINTKGPEAWPQEKGLTTLDKLENYLRSVQHNQPESNVTDETINTEKKEEKKPEVVYVDENGNPIPPPLDIPATIEEAKQAIRTMQLQSAKTLLTTLTQETLSPEQNEEVLYLLSEVNEKIYKDRWLEGYEPIVSSTNAAMNANLRSPRVAEALMRLGMINLLTGNQDEAEGYFGALRRKFPQDALVPQGYLALGKDQFAKGQYADAVKTFQIIMDNYPESKAVQDAARFMAEALFKQGHYSRALILVDFVDRRWPRLYLEDPSYLTMVGDLYDITGRLDDALKYYWIHYNLTPQAKDNHKLLLNIGSAYLKKGLLKGSKDVFEELLKKYPDSESAPKALLAMGEEQIPKDNPTLEELFTIFQNPSSTIPEIYYKRIIADYPNSPEAKQAEIRLAAWKLWNRDIPSAMKLAQQFIDQNPGSPYSKRAEEIILRGFDQSFALALQEENYERILSLWEKYPYVQLVYKNMRDDLRVALARAYLNRGNEEKGMDMLEPFLGTPQNPTYGDYTYNLYLARYLRNGNWDKILELGEKVAHWNLPTSARVQLDYAMAIAAENLGLGSKALPLWKKLYQREDIPLYQKAYATYFMARDAERRRDLDAAYKLNMDTLKLFLTLEEERSDKADAERVRESIAALMDVTEVANRFAEALDWADKYAPFVSNTSPDYAGFLFRKARLHRKMGNLDKWKQLLEEIIKREPESVFGKMAASELRTQEVSRDLNRFTQ